MTEGTFIQWTGSDGEYLGIVIKSTHRAVLIHYGDLKPDGTAITSRSCWVPMVCITTTEGKHTLSPRFVSKIMVSRLLLKEQFNRIQYPTEP